MAKNKKYENPQRLPQAWVERMTKGDTIRSKKGYRRKGRGVRRGLNKDIEDQMKGSGRELLIEEWQELQYYLDVESDLIMSRNAPLPKDIVLVSDSD